jgi:hypothetical protein
MTVDEYIRYYLEFIMVGIGSSVMRAANALPRLESDLPRQQDYENTKRGLTVLLLVSFIEANFLSGNDMSLLRKFTPPRTTLSALVNPIHLSGFIYLRDSFAHDPSGVLFGEGDNTSGFARAVADGTFPWATIAGNSITVDPSATRELHFIVLRLFGEEV